MHVSVRILTILKTFKPFDLFVKACERERERAKENESEREKAREKKRENERGSTRHSFNLHSKHLIGLECS